MNIINFSTDSIAYNLFTTTQIIITINTFDTTFTKSFRLIVIVNLAENQVKSLTFKKHSQFIPYSFIVIDSYYKVRFIFELCSIFVIKIVIHLSFFLIIKFINFKAPY